MKIEGFTDYGIDAVVKFGGSLLFEEAQARAAIQAIAAAPTLGRRVLVMPGGGPTDKTIEALDRRHPFQPETHHRACARAQDQTGLMICDPCFSTVLKPVETLVEARTVLDQGGVPVLLPSKLIFTVDPFERTWVITSDAMSVWLAWLVGAPLAIILTNVDGVFAPGHIGEPDHLIRSISPQELMALGHTAVDSCTAPFLQKSGISCWVLHGQHPERLVDVFAGRETIGTHVKRSS